MLFPGFNLYEMLDITGKRIAIVEDDIASLKYYETLLRETGAQLTGFPQRKGIRRNRHFRQGCL